MQSSFFRNASGFPWFVTLLTAFFCFFSAQAYALEKNTAFLPFKINASNPSQLAEQADKALESVLLDKGYTLISRSEARKMVNYEGIWPPPADVLNKIAEKTGNDNIAIGSLTQLGSHYSLDMSVFDLLLAEAPYSSFRETDSLEALPVIMGEIVDNALSYSNRDFTIASIVPAGNERIDAGAILRKISTKPGDLYDPGKLRLDMKSVFSMGYFDSIEIESTESETGKHIVFRVQEKPLISEIIIAGTDSLKEEDVRDAANLSPKTILNPTQINDAVARVKEYYKSKGYYTTKVKADISYPTPEKAQVKLIIEEGDKITIEEIVFQGNTTFDDDELEDLMQTGEYAWWHSWLTDTGVLKKDILNQDAARIGAFYHNHGFIDAKVGNPIVEYKDNDLYITVPIEEGGRYKVGLIEVRGDMIEDKQAIISKLQIRQENFLNRQVLREDITRITDLYAGYGYAFAEIDPRIRKTEQGKRVDITFTISQGPLVYFNRVEIEGNIRTRDNVIRRDLTIEEGGVFSSTAIRNSTQKLQRLDFFEEVTITPKPTLYEDQMDILVDVKEKSTGQFSIGAGYSSSEKLMFMGEIKENNFLGTGNEITLSANLSSKSIRYNLNFTNPRLFDSRVSGGVDLFNWEREYDDYTKDSTGFGLRLGHPFYKKWYINYGYTLADTNLTDISDNASEIILRSAEINLTSSLRVSLTRDTRDRYFSPKKGSRNAVSVEYAGGPLGGDAQFTKVEASSSWWLPMIWETVFHIKGAAGQAFENEDNQLPVYEHFYLGGMNSIRGFKSMSISPLNPANDEKIGGDKMWYANVGIIFPLLKDMGIDGEIFTDFGNVYAAEDNWDLSDYKKTAGIAMHWLSPLGPLRMAWGYNLDQQKGEDSSNWDFTMGGSF